MMARYKNYFKNHYKAKLVKEDIDNYLKWFHPQFDLIKKILKLKRKARVLEIGSGYGGFYNILDKNGLKYDYVGLELDKDAANFANDYFNTKVFINKSFEKYKDSQKYDYIFAFEVLEHVENPELFIKKIHENLKKGGYFVGTSPYPFFKNIYADETHRYVLHPSNWRKLFIDNRFTTSKTYPMTFLPYLWRINKNINVRIPFYLPTKHMISTSLIISRK